MIEKMEKISLFGLSQDSKQLIADLMACGLVQVRSPESLENYEELEAQMGRFAPESYQSEQIFSRLEAAVGALLPYTGKKGLLYQRPRVSFETVSASQSLEEALTVCESVEAVQRKMAEERQSIGKFQFQLESLLPWEGADIPFELSMTASCEVGYTIFPLATSMEELEEAVETQGIGAYWETISEDADQRYVAWTCHGGDGDAFREMLRQHGGTRVSFSELKGTAAENIGRCRRNIQAFETKLAEREQELKALAGQVELLEMASDCVQVALDCGTARQLLLHTDTAYMLTGWLPVRHRAQVEKVLESYTCQYSFHEPEEGEDAPILIKNSKLVEPFGTITEMYALPTYTGLDANPFVAPFFFIFFGMMYSDAAYGLILAVLGFWAVKKLDFNPGMKRMLNLLALCGVSTVFWGAVFGSWFADLIPTIAGHFFGKEIKIPQLIDPMNEPITILIISIAFGYIHILVGLGLKAYLLIRRGHIADAIFDVGFWYMVLIGLPLLLVGGMVGTIGQWVAILGAVGLVCTQGRDKPSIIGKITSGILSLYDITGYFSDLLSYSRILALGLATAVVGSVFNILATLPGHGIIAALFAIVILVIGHAFNLLINGLGAYVHASRLQYVEFFSKFYESGGEKFTPLLAKTKYVVVTQTGGK